MNRITLRLTLDVTYSSEVTDNEPLNLEALKSNLEDIAQNAADRGLMSQGLGVAVTNWEANVMVDLLKIRSAKLGTPEHKAFIEALEILADSVEGGSIQKGYSGRGMFGKLCYGVDCDDINMALRKVGALNLPTPQTDSMGFGAILYWPGIEGEEETE